MNVLSLFDGISCGQQAIKELGGGRHLRYFASEIKEDAIKVTMDNHPSTFQLGDVTKVKGKNLPSIDLLIGGSPCQSFSNAGKLQGFDGKSGLFWEYARLLKEVKPKYFLLENVKMKKEWQDIISKELGVEPININSKLVSAQLRNRFYWTNIPNVTQPDDLGIKLQDILTDGVTDRDKCRAILESESRPLKNPEGMLWRYIAKGFTTIVYQNNETILRVKEATKKGFTDIRKNEGVDLTYPSSKTRRGRAMRDKIHTIMQSNCEYYLFDGGGIRYFNQTELERCQTLPAGYTKCLSRNKAAGVIGDGWTVAVIKHILKNVV